MKSSIAIRMQGQLIRFLAVFLAALTLSACGGGDGFPGFRAEADAASNTPMLALFTTAPASVTIAVAASATYAIGGGTAPYTVTSGNTGVATTSVNGSSFSIQGLSNGSASITIVDAVGGTLSTNATIGSSTPESATALFVTAPRSVAMAIGATPAYAIGGGTAPYTVYSGDTRVVTGIINATTLTITSVAAGSAQISVFDAKGATVAINVTVGANATATPLYVTAPSTVTLWTQGTSSVFTVGGGTPPYIASSSDERIALPDSRTLPTAGYPLSITAGSATGTAQISVFDATGSAVVFAVTVKTPLYTTAPSAITIAKGSAPTYALGGGTAPYTVVSSNTLAANASVIGGTTLQITGVAPGTADVVLTDAYAATQTIGVTVTAVTSTPLVATPSSASGNVGNVLTIRVSGGVPPYTPVANNPSFASITPASVPSSGGSFGATLLNAGSSTVVIVDALGQATTLTLDATVGLPAPAPLALFPAALSIGEDYAAPITLSILNGTAPYRAYTSDLVLSNVAVSGSTLTFGLGTQGSRCFATGKVYDQRAVTITVVDDLGAAATSVVTIQDNGKGGAGCL